MELIDVGAEHPWSRDLNQFSHQDARSVSAFAIGTGIRIGVASLLLHMSRAMIRIVDGFCERYAAGPDGDLAESAKESAPRS